jgi:DNA-binding MarR family transcriptional regulator
MISSTATTRTEAIDLVSTTLLRRASLLLRLVTSFGTSTLTRTETGLLLTLLDGARRITELAETEALAQPTVTKLVDKLQQRGLVVRERCVDDGRVVLVSISSEGREQIEASRIQAQALMRETVAELSNDELADLVAASESMDRMIDALQQRKARR